MSAVLKIHRDGKVLQTHELREAATLGRAEGCVIRLDDHAVSRKHAVLSPDHSAQVVRFERKSDFGWIRHNGVEVTTGVARPGDILEVGPFQIEISGGAPEAAQGPANFDLAAPELVAALPSEISTSIAPPVDAPPVSVIEAPVPSEPPEFVAEPAQDPAPEPVMDLADSFPGLEAEAPLVALSEQPVAEPPSLGGAEKTSVFDPDGPTRLTPIAGISARLVFAPGAANVDAFDLSGRDRILIGRGGSGKPVDVELKDRKASRLHLEIVSANGRYLLKDLGSPNGTYIDGHRLEARAECEIHSGARIRAGEAEFVFEVMSQDYSAREASFLPAVHQEAAMQTDEPGGESGFPGFEVEQPLDPLGIGLQPGVEAINASLNTGLNTDLSTPPPPQGGIKGLWARYKSYPRKSRYMFLAIIVAAASLLTPEEEPAKKTAKKKSAPVVSASGAPQGRTFEDLSPEMQKQVMQGREQATNYYRAHEYENALNETKLVLSILPNDETAKTIATYAMKAIEKRKQLQEEENQRRVDEERLVKIKTIIEELSALMESARKKKDLPGKFDEVEQKINDSGITILDPNNADIPKWQQEINAFREDQANIERARTDVLDKRQAAFANYRELEPLRKAALDAKEPAEQIRKLGALFAKLLDIEMALPREEGGAYSDKVTAAEYKKIEELHRKVTNELEECRSRVEKFMDPFVAEAQSRESEAQASSDTEKYNEAFKKWNTVAQLEELQQEAWLKQSGVEASDSKGDLGMARIRGILNERAKAIYTEGILAESYSDFAKAREKFEELQKIAPSDDQSVDSYFARARRKLAVYSQFDAALGRARQPAAETPPVAPQPVPTEPPPQSGGTL